MLSSLNIKGFKCFANQDIILSKINLWVGANSSGKSSCGQALRLALMNADVSKDNKSYKAKIYPRFGSFQENRNMITNAKTFQIGLSGNGNTLNESFYTDDNRVSTFVSIEESPKEPLAERMYYLPASRVSSLDSYPYTQNEDGILGADGSLVYELLYNHQSDTLKPELIADKNTLTFSGQVNYWLKKLTGYTLEVTFSNNSYNILFKSEVLEGRTLRPYNVGTGVSYIATVIIATLAASDKDVVIIENPELHLHPKAQADITDFFCFVAKTNTQIFIESHSDHIFNGLRRNIAKGGAKPEDVQINYFQSKSNGITEVHSVVIDVHGDLSEFPEGMFDQFDNDLDEIIRYEAARRNN